MKRSIFLYLFVFTLLLVVFQYVNSKNIQQSKKQIITTWNNEKPFVTKIKSKIKSQNKKKKNYYYFKRRKTKKKNDEEELRRRTAT